MYAYLTCAMMWSQFWEMTNVCRWGIGILSLCHNTQYYYVTKCAWSDSIGLVGLIHPSVCLLVCLFVCLCEFVVCMYVCLCVCLYVYLCFCLYVLCHVYLSVCLPVWKMLHTLLLLHCSLLVYMQATCCLLSCVVSTLLRQSLVHLSVCVLVRDDHDNIVQLFLFIVLHCPLLRYAMSSSCCSLMNTDYYTGSKQFTFHRFCWYVYSCNTC